MVRVKLAWLGCVLVVVAAGVAYAQRDAGAKARGEFGTGFWSSQYSRSSGAASTSQRYRSSERIATNRRASVQERGYQVSSYEPTGILTGDTVTIAKDNTQVMRGTTPVGILAKGRQFQVLKIVNGWLGVVIEEEGQVKRGWVWHQDVTPAAAAANSQAGQ